VITLTSADVLADRTRTRLLYYTRAPLRAYKESMILLVPLVIRNCNFRIFLRDCAVLHIPSGMIAKLLGAVELTQKD
jgi:hypothetical protein